ncbi:dipeptidase [Paenibacillus beijingensis]|uniref:Peptidase M20 n=1 Tax=Paenibacillus beijingensis TaxID=1126833 RepID=A0A0D5NND6_9BACL|nr:dipeptidase [Paenibacillus beijingensis]AJY76781.1 peptidase M20 [Paenibacillus beijingensis]
MRLSTHYEQFLQNNRNRHLEELKQFLSIPSISALSEHKPNMVQAAEWTAEALRQIGIENVQVIPTEGNPVVYGDWLKAEGKPTSLIYGHYDVQPVDPLHLWETPPFEPEIIENKIFARGASDNKGQMFIHIKALEALLASDGTLPVNVKLCFEGEEEIGSVHFDAFIKAHKERLAADVLVISDSVMYAKGKPAIIYGLRGLCGMQIDVKGPKGDLHSGLYGGAVQNPIHALVQILDSMRNKQGEITIDGFYDQVRNVSEEEREQFRSLQFNEEQMSQELQVTELFGEKDYSVLERTWVRPTLEINGIYGGFKGEGNKTVLPSEAHAKITCRLVPDQDPDDIVERIQRHIDRHTPPGAVVTTTRFDSGKPFVTPFDHPAIQAAGRAYRYAYGVEAVYIRSGGSIPIVETFATVLNIPVVMMGFGLNDENIHAPNEHFHLDNFDKGIITVCQYWFELEDSL